MILPDVNILLYGFLPEMEYHSTCYGWLRSLAEGSAVYGISPQVLSSFVRVVTSPKAFRPPKRLNEALQFCDTLIEQPHCELIQPGKRHWSIFQDLCRNADVKGNLVTDAWFAALAIESGCEWITYDRDYARFPGLRWRVPE